MAAALVLTQFVSMAIGRRHEFQADRYALAHLDNKEALVHALVKSCKLSGQSARPTKLYLWLFSDHPSVQQRIDAARAALTAS